MKTRSFLRRFDDIDLAVRQHGKGLPVVWGHGLLGSMRVEDQAGICNWEEVENHAGLVRYDARGHGNSDGSYDSRDYRWKTLAGDMLAVAKSVMQERGVDRCVLAGLSMGAATALEAAIQQPENVAGLVLILPPTAWETRSRQARIYRRLAWLSGLFGAIPYRILDWLPTSFGDDPKSLLALSTARGLAVANPLHVQAALRGAAMSDLPDMAKLKKLNVPTIILTWYEDVAHPVSTATTLAELLPDVRSLIISDAQDCSAWTSDICQFLDEIAKEKKRPAKKIRRTRKKTTAKKRSNAAT